MSHLYNGSRARLDVESLEGRWQPSASAGGGLHCAAAACMPHDFHGQGNLENQSQGLHRGWMGESHHHHHGGHGHCSGGDTGGGTPAPAPQPALGSLSGFVFLDSNGNGVLDDGEQPLSGTPVMLWWVDAAGVVQELNTVTGADGSYHFDKLAGGIEYNIVETQPFPYQDGPDFLGNLGGSQSDDMFTVVLPTGANGQNYNFTEVFGE